MIIWVVITYIAIPVLGILISGRKITWQGCLLFIALWPIAWLFTKPEELP